MAASIPKLIRLFPGMAGEVIRDSEEGGIIPLALPYLI